MNENQNEIEPKPKPHAPRLEVRPRIEILFEFAMLKPKPTFYRAVKAVDGSFRMEKRGRDAKKISDDYVVRVGTESSQT